MCPYSCVLENKRRAFIRVKGNAIVNEILFY